MKPVWTSFNSPRQNGVAECFIGSSRRDLLEEVIVLNECHLKGLMADYIFYHRDHCAHLGLKKGIRLGAKSGAGGNESQSRRDASTRRSAPSLRPSSLRFLLDQSLKKIARKRRANRVFRAAACEWIFNKNAWLQNAPLHAR